MLGIIFSNIYDSSLGELTSHRTVASLPFGGRYRQIDFILSNMVNSNITRIGLITKYNYQSLMDHLGSCQEWDLNRKNGGLFILPPFASGNTGIYRGKLEALHVAIRFLENSNEEYVLMSDSMTLCNIDFRPVLESHMKSGCDVTAVANRDPETDIHNNLVMHANRSNRVTDIALQYPSDEKSWQGMGMFIMSRKQLLEVVLETTARGMYHFERDFLQRYFNDGKIKVNIYPFDGISLRNTNIPAYFKNNFRLCDPAVRKSLFRPEAPIYTKVRDEIPTYYGNDAHISNCIVADGCRLNGNVRDSVLFRDVSVQNGSHISNSIIMQSANIGENVRLEYVILDKQVHITDGTTLIGSPQNPVIISKGDEV